jgi:beta-lactam-binding protein with PASTA domain
MCETPAWVSEIISSTRSGQIIPVPVALNKVANETRDRYNPVVSITSGALATATKTALTAAGFTAVDGNATIDSALPAGRALAITASATYNAGEIINSIRVPIADVTGRIQTTLYVHAASGYNAMPNVVGLTASAARAALVAAGFTGTAVTGDDAVLVTAQSIAAGTRTILGTQVTLTAPIG